MALEYFFLGVLGLVIGSFVAAYTYRASHGLSIKSGRSRCDTCKKQIDWYDNIPVLSYALLGGRCRHCKSKISPRYPAIELSLGIGFVLVFFLQSQIFSNTFLPNNVFGLIYLLLVFSVLAAVFIIDLESQIIPDELNYFLIILGTLALFFTSNNMFFQYIFSGFFLSLFLLLVNLLTGGRGMGLGDVKFAIFPGLALGPILGTIWLFLSFILGAMVGVFLILIGKAKIGRHIPFGPFLVISLMIVSVFGNIIKMKLFP